MKILYITTDSHLAGTEKNILNLMKYMKAIGNEIELLTLMGNGELIKEAKKIGIEADNLKLKKNNIFKYGKLKKALRKEKYDIIHSFLFHANILSRIFKPKGVKLINSFRSEDKWKKWYHYALERWTIAKVDDFTINFPCFDEFQRKHSIKKNIIYIPNGIDVKQENLYNAQPFIVKLIGRFHEVKQHIPLMKNYLEHNIMNKDIKFQFIGRGPLKHKVENFIIKNNLEHVFKIEPFKEKERELYKNTSTVICVSKYEGFPNTLLEASSYGIPTVSFNVGAATDIIENGKNGFLVKDFNELFDKLIELKNNREIYKKMNFKRVKEKFSLEKINNKFLDLYM
ncbi:glycosyltransferase family 4 protein [bacterium]|nr:glycosyltransferase family 4 protein [bacterium]